MKNKAKYIILDCDTGEDDALAILVALANNLPLDYIITSYGNTSLKNSTANTANILGLAGNNHIKVLPFSRRALKPHLIERNVDAANFIGKNGLCNTIIPTTKVENILKGLEKQQEKKLIEILKEQKSTDYIITGPCTNFAKVCLTLGSEIKQYVHALYIMGGSIHTHGNSGPIDKKGDQMAEFNFYCDPYAADIVLNSGLPIYLITWDMTETIGIPFAWIQNFQSKIVSGKFVVQMMRNFFTYYGLDQNRDFELNDPVTILAQMGWGSYKKKKVRVLRTIDAFGKVILAKAGADINYFTLTKREKRKSIEKILGDLQIQRQEK